MRVHSDCDVIAGFAAALGQENTLTANDISSPISFSPTFWIEELPEGLHAKPPDEHWFGRLVQPIKTSIIVLENYSLRTAQPYVNPRTFASSFHLSPPLYCPGHHVRSHMHLVPLCSHAQCEFPDALQNSKIAKEQHADITLTNTLNASLFAGKCSPCVFTSFLTGLASSKQPESCILGG
jgi:hypothetical protein